MTNTYRKLQAKVYSIIYPDGIPLEMDIEKRDWEDNFYDSDWNVDTVEVAESEKAFMEEMSNFMPRHMAVYDWNLPYNEFILLKIRRHFRRELSLQDFFRAIGKKYGEYSSRTIIWGNGIMRMFDTNFNIDKPLKDQDEETLIKLLDLLE